MSLARPPDDVRAAETLGEAESCRPQQSRKKGRKTRRSETATTGRELRPGLRRVSGRHRGSTTSGAANDSQTQTRRPEMNFVPVLWKPKNGSREGKQDWSHRCLMFSEPQLRLRYTTSTMLQHLLKRSSLRGRLTVGEPGGNGLWLLCERMDQVTLSHVKWKFFLPTITICSLYGTIWSLEITAVRSSACSTKKLKTVAMGSDGQSTTGDGFAGQSWWSGVLQPRSPTLSS